MRIGTIAQHANVGPTGFNSIVDVLPGRLNDYDLTLWYDFTDNSTISVAGTPTPVEIDASNMSSITDKGPNAVKSNAQSFGPDTKGPSYFYNNDLDNSSKSQNFHNYGQGGLDADVLGFTNPTTFSSRAFTLVIIFDTTAESDDGNPNDIGTVDQTLIHMVGSTSGGNLRNLRFDIAHDSSGDRLEFFIQKNDGSTFTLGNSDTKLSTVFAGTTNTNFNYAVITNNLSTDNIDFYLKGNLASSGPLGVNENMPAGTACKLFTRSDGIANLTNLAQSRLYEFMIFNQALTQTELYDIDLYVKNKYNFQFGRINGF